MGLHRIAMRLSDEHVLTKRDKATKGKINGVKRRKKRGTWTSHTIHRIISDPVYMGEWAFNKKYPNGRLKPESE